MSETTVVRWRRYGKDRLYVKAADGTTLGWRDLVTGDDHLETPDRASIYRDAVAAWTHAGLLTAASVASSTFLSPSTAATAAQPSDHDAAHLEGSGLSRMTTSSDTSVEPAWNDLAARPAGALARQRAIELREAAPVRTFIARALGAHTEERAWRIGADGEEKVAAQLAKLARHDPRWRFLHAVEVGENGSDVDHVVIGPAGVFTLNAKHHPHAKVWVGGNTFMVNGAKLPYIRNSRSEAARASKLLTTACGFPVAVTGVVVPVGADDVTIRKPPVDVHVVNRMALVRWFRNLPVVLNDATTASVFDVARRSTVWTAAANHKQRSKDLRTLGP